MEKLFNIIKIVDIDDVIAYIYIDNKLFTYERGYIDLFNFFNINKNKLILDYYWFEYDNKKDVVEIKIYTKKI